jgi:glycerol transport system ATP-binding protein
VVKDGDRVLLSSNGVGWGAKSGVRELPNGRYTLGVRPHSISPVPNGGATVEIAGRVLITELSGAESVIHFAHGELTWTSQSHGVHAVPVGETATFHMDAGQCMYFDAGGRLVAS